MHRASRVAELGAVLLVLTTLVGCAIDGPDFAEQRHPTANFKVDTPADKFLMQGLKEARAGRWQEAQSIFGSLLRHDLRNSRLQFLNALAYEQLARRNEPELFDLARVGYRNAIDFSRGNYWAQLHLGFLELDRGNFAAAQAAFGGAVRDQPERWEGLFGLGAASYYAGDTLGAALAAERARTVAPSNPLVLRLAAFTLAATGEDPHPTLKSYTSIAGDDVYVTKRVNEIMRDVRLAQLLEPQTAAPPSAATTTAESTQNQVTVDVTIVLSSLLKIENRGVNLFDGLSAQYSLDNSLSSTRDSGSPYSSVRAITQTISVPVLNYNLNLFNDSGQFYQVLARPTLTAFVGRESEFFAGRTVNVTVSGVNLGALQPIDVGVGLNVTPESIDGRKVTFKVSASRSFLSREEIGTFNESLTTFKQLVSATAEVEFGQTLLLSALSESVQDSNFSRVPILGRIPGPNLLTSQNSKANRRESLLILLTPTRPAAIQTSLDGSIRPSELENLLKFWKEVVDPNASVDAITKRLSASRFFSSGEAGDIRWSGARTQRLLDEALEENVNLARR